MDQRLVDRFEELLESDQNDPEIQYQIGLCYQRGEGVEQNGVEAEKWLRRAEAGGHQGAASLLARCASPQESLTGEVTQDTLPDWCLQAEQGNMEAQYKVGCYFLQMPNTQAEGEQYLEKAMEQGSGEASLILGQRMLERGQAEQAVAMLRRAADNSGQPKAAFLLGRCYMEGTGVPQNAELAEQYVTQGAEAGGSETMVEVAARYTMGEGLPHAPVKGLSWLKRAENAGMKDARARYDARCDQLQKEREEQAKRAAEQEARKALVAAQQAQKQARIAQDAANRWAEAERFRQAEDAKQAVQDAKCQAETLRRAEQETQKRETIRMQQQQEQRRKRGRVGRILLLLGVLGPLEMVWIMVFSLFMDLFKLPSISLPPIFMFLQLPLLLTPGCLALMAGGLQKMLEAGDDEWYFGMTGKKVVWVTCVALFAVTETYMVLLQLGGGWSIFSVIWGIIKGILGLGTLFLINYGLIEVFKIDIGFLRKVLW